MELILCSVVESSCVRIHNIVPHIDHEEIRRFSEHGDFQVHPAEIVDSNMVL